MYMDVEKLAESKFNYWAAYVANLTLVSWFFYQGVVGFQSSGAAWPMGFLWAGVGFFVYSLTEYFFHRFLYHEWTSIFVQGHDLHHKNPTGLLGLPWYIPYPLLIGIYFLLRWVTGNQGAVGVGMAAWWLGFVGYCAVHHSIHHFDFRNSWFRRLKIHHRVHHAVDTTNYGVLTTFWDVLFSTKLRKASEAPAHLKH
jgi:sterol desaturase/sphingolipid hydroxylase (fatty acid hydroxylase superfamily)